MRAYHVLACKFTVLVLHERHDCHEAQTAHPSTQGSLAETIPRSANGAAMLGDVCLARKPFSSSNHRLRQSISIAHLKYRFATDVSHDRGHITAGVHFEYYRFCMKFQVCMKLLSFIKRTTPSSRTQDALSNHSPLMNP